MKINREKLVEEIRVIHPKYEEKVISNIADSIINDLNDELKEILAKYLESGEKSEYKHNEFTLFMIHDGFKYSYLESIILMNEYIKDNLKGKSLNLRRRDK